MNTLEALNKGWQSPTPPLFQKIRNIGLILVSIAGAILALPDVIPEIIVTAAGYALAVGSSLSVIAQATSEEKPVLPKSRKKGVDSKS